MTARTLVRQASETIRRQSSDDRLCPLLFIRSSVERAPTTFQPGARLSPDNRRVDRSRGRRQYGLQQACPPDEVDNDTGSRCNKRARQMNHDLRTPAREACEKLRRVKRFGCTRSRLQQTHQSQKLDRAMRRARSSSVVRGLARVAAPLTHIKTLVDLALQLDESSFTPDKGLQTTACLGRSSLVLLCVLPRGLKKGSTDGSPDSISEVASVKPTACHYSTVMGESRYRDVSLLLTVGISPVTRAGIRNDGSGTHVGRAAASGSAAQAIHIACRG